MVICNTYKNKTNNTRNNENNYKRINKSVLPKEHKKYLFFP